MKNKLKTKALAGLLAVGVAFQAAPVQAAETAEDANIFAAIASSVLETQEYVEEVGQAHLKAANAKGEAIADAAMAQIGVMQDCTMLVTNSLKAVDIDFHGWPHEYSELGDWTDDPVPGDIIIYSGHVAIYVGDGKAVHGGWNGGTTVLTTVACSQPLVGYIHVN